MFTSFSSSSLPVSQINTNTSTNAAGQDSFSFALSSESVRLCRKLAMEALTKELVALNALESKKRNKLQQRSELLHKQIELLNNACQIEESTALCLKKIEGVKEQIKQLSSQLGIDGFETFWKKMSVFESEQKQLEMQRDALQKERYSSHLTIRSSQIFDESVNLDLKVIKDAIAKVNEDALMNKLTSEISSIRKKITAIQRDLGSFAMQRSTQRCR